MRSFRYELVDGSTLVDAEHVKFTVRDVWLVVYVTRRRVTVVSRTLNRTRAINRKRKTSYAIAWEEFSIRRQ